MLRPRFADRYPGRPRILFVGRADSAHTQAWIGLLDGARFNVRLFSPPMSSAPPPDFDVQTYVSAARHSGVDSPTRAHLISPSASVGRLQRYLASRRPGGYRRHSMRWLARIVREWKPDIVHTLGLLVGGSFYHEARRAFRLEDRALWVLQLWGGADLWSNDPDGRGRTRIDEALLECDQLFDDNANGIEYALRIGCRPEQIASIGLVPGNGGVDLAAIDRLEKRSPSQRRTIVWPKAYDTPWSRPLPVLEGLRIAWPRIPPVTVQVLAATEETRSWIARLPTEIRERFVVHDMLRQSAVLEIFADARLMLAPSLIDGVPNVMLEAMAAGALPIVSPLETITPIVSADENVLFARNLYPDEIAAAIIQGMLDDRFVDSAWPANRRIVESFADRAEIRARVIGYYDSLVRAERYQQQTQP